MCTSEAKLVPAFILQKPPPSQRAASPPLTGVACRCVEIGCGSGYVMCSLALGLQQLHRPCGMMTCTDVNPLALSATQATLAAHQVGAIAGYAECSTSLFAVATAWVKHMCMGGRSNRSYELMVTCMCSLRQAHDAVLEVCMLSYHAIPRCLGAWAV